VVGNLPLNPDLKVIYSATKELIDRLLLERLSLAGIARALKVSQQRLQDYVNRKYALFTPPGTGVIKKKGKLTIQCDELWSFVDHKGNKQWIWLALDAKTCEIVGVYIGARDSAALERIMEIITAGKNDNVPSSTRISGRLTRRCYQASRHQAVVQETGKTS
jgi:insertion element IS1 protein InsB